MKIFGAGVLIVSGVLAAAVPAAAKSELILAIGGEPDTGYDPLLGWGRYGHPLFQSTLLKRDAALETVPDLASARSLSDDRLVWTITLRPGVTFSDGTSRDISSQTPLRLDGIKQYEVAGAAARQAPAAAETIA